MRSLIVHGWIRIAPLVLGCGALCAQTAPAQPRKIEPGLEDAVKWKWHVAPSANPEWGMPLPEALVPKAGPAVPAVITPTAPEAPIPTTYEVKKGDAILRIARKFHMTADELKQFNNMKDDRIVVGQVLRIPTPGERIAMEPKAQPMAEPEAKKEPETKEKTKAETKAEISKKKKDGKSAETQGGAVPTYEQLVLNTVLVQVFLDREMFSSGGIDGNSGPLFQKLSQLYLSTHTDVIDPSQLKTKALAVVKQPYTNYALRAEDFKFIKPRALPPVPVHESKSAAAKKASRFVKLAPPVIPLTYQDLVSADFLGYASVWEFLAERFHCDEAFLRQLNSKLDESPAIGTIFQVPNVIPFEIEKALDLPLQPAADPQKPVTAAVVGLSLLEISCEGRLVAVMPVAAARPGFHGRGTWTILDAIPHPRMATRHEANETPKTPNAPAAPAQATPPPLDADQYLPPGPNNPVGIVWINLAKAKSTEALPYGLHGTSIPAHMKSWEGIGGLRLTNWDLARAVRLLPAGTPLEWKVK